MSTAIRALVPTKLASLNLLVAANECRRMSRYNTTSTSVGRMTALQHFSVVEEIERGFQWCGANEAKARRPTTTTGKGFARHRAK